MKELLVQYARYNAWANAQFIHILRKLDENQLDMEIASSYPTIRKTVYHMWSAEDIWIQRLNLAEQPVWLGDTFDGEFSAAVANWEAVSKQLLLFTEKQFSNESFQHVMQYHNLKRQPVKIAVFACLMQVFNHATYHRGQLVTMFRQAGVKKIPSTDFHIFASKQA